MNTRHMLTTLSTVIVVAAVAIPTAASTPDGYVVRTGSALDAKSAIESRTHGTNRSVRQGGAPDGYQPQLATSAGAAGAPDNLVRDVPRGTFSGIAVEPGPDGRSFDWSAGVIGVFAGFLLALLAAGLWVAARGSTLARA